MDAPNGRADRPDPGRLAGAAFIVVIVVFAGLRLFEIGPWVLPAFDVYAYWATRAGLDYANAHPGATGAYLYSPAFAQVIASLTALPWPVFAGLWTLLIAAPLPWLVGRFAIVLLLLPPVAMSVVLGQLDLLYAAVIVLGFRWPAVWVLPILTKVTPGVGLLWFLVRREWRSLGIALGTTLAVALASAVLDPRAWRDWFQLLSRMEFPALGGGLWFLPVPLWIRLSLAAALIAWGARTDRRWVLPVGVCLSLPTVWLNSPTILVALLPLAGAGRPLAGAGRRTPRAAHPSDTARQAPIRSSVSPT